MKIFYHLDKFLAGLFVFFMSLSVGYAASSQARQGGQPILPNGQSVSSPSERATTTNPSGQISITPGANGQLVPEKNSQVTGKLRECRAVKQAISKRSQQMLKRAEMLEVKFADISQKVDNYYFNKLVPSGKTLSNYLALKADIASKKGVIDMDLLAAKTNLLSFSCSGNNPKEVMSGFRLNMQALNSALQEYRLSIKNLIGAIFQIIKNPIQSTAKEK